MAQYVLKLTEPTSKTPEYYLWRTWEFPSWPALVYYLCDQLDCLACHILDSPEPGSYMTPEGDLYEWYAK